METLDSTPAPPQPLMRDRRRGWVGGVCAGIAQARGLPLGWMRAGFVLAALAGGLGLLAYAACWLIIPGDEETPTTRVSRAVVVLAQCCAAAAGLATLAAAAGIAAVFGFGWLVLLVAALTLVAALAAWPRVGPAWALLPLAAMVAPALAMAAGRVEVEPSSADRHVVPAAVAAFPAGGYRSGLGHLFVDLRRTAFPTTGAVRLKIRAGVKRTIVALPHDRCVHLVARWHVRPFAARIGQLLQSGSDFSSGPVATFGQQSFLPAGSFIDGSAHDERQSTPGPTLTLDFESAGGSLVVRDFPDAIDPQREPNWPGFPSGVEPKPAVDGVPRREVNRLMRLWRQRAREQRRRAKAVAAALPGPCWTGVKAR